MEIEVSNLTKKYGDVTVLDDLNFSIGKGEIIGFLGPNGAGKTTTMRILTGFLAPTQGDVKISNLDLLNNSIAIRKLIGYLPENNPLYTEMKIYEYLEFVARAKGVSNIKDEVKRVMRACSLQDRVDQYTGELSKGFRQRVGLAQALIGDPEILVLDEPTSGLDPNQIVDIRNLIKEVGKTKTVLLSTHILSEVQATCTRAIIIHKGKIIASGTTEELIRQAENKTHISLIVSEKSEDFENALKNISGIENVSFLPQTRAGEVNYALEATQKIDPRKDIFHLCVEKNNVLLGMEYKTLSLEDVFRQLTKQ